MSLLLALFCFPVLAQGYTEGTYQATAQGFGGVVKVTMTFTSEGIQDVLAEGQNETEGVGAAALEPLSQQILDAQGIDIDGVSGATVTSNAVKAAASDCIRQATGAQVEIKIAKDGVYEAKAFGFMSEISVAVTVLENAISAIDVISCNDTGLIGVAAANELCKTVVETQSLGVDAVAGATATSKGFLAAVSAAMEAAGADGSALSKVDVPKRSAQTEEVETEILVIGAGMAGLCTAIEAAQEGANVLVLEKEGVFGGSTTRSEGFVMGADTSVQAQYGVHDTAQAMYDDMYALYRDEPTLDVELLRKVVDESASLID